MSELKRPERYVNFESIKPELREITEFYTRKVKDYLHCLKQLNEYADALENEISALKETYVPKIKMTLDQRKKIMIFIWEDENFEDFLDCYGHGEKLYKEFSEKELMRAWLNPELLEVVG